jgi:hypothetical protein
LRSENNYVISTEGGAFAAVVERSLYFAFATPSIIAKETTPVA